MTLLRRHSNISCFFCLSAISPLPQNPRSFRCPHCSCWNRYDTNGEIVSEEPAMHQETLNTKSFAKRASPSKDQLPTTRGSGPFCHTCQTNQTLLMNLLSNYLPPPDDPEYTSRIESFPEYRSSLHLRYPPVCSDCFPAVEDEIREKDHMARTRALGGWLKESKGKEKKRQVSGKGKEGERLGIELVAWRVRGCLWVMSLASALLGNTAGTFAYHLPRLSPLQPALPTFALCSVLWTFWDPTYSSIRRAQIQGRDMRVRGKNNYIAFQMIAWLSRMLTSVLLALAWLRPTSPDFLHLAHGSPSTRSRIYFSFSLISELFVLVCSYFALRLQHPPAIRLIDTDSHKIPSSRQTPAPTSNLTTRSSTPLVPAEPDLFATLSLTNKPIISTPNPVFGLPSLAPSSSAMGNGSLNNQMDEDADADAMDWTPTNPPISHDRKGKRRIVSGDDDGSWLRPQRFFPPEHPTGLEGLFARTKLADDTDGRPGLVGRMGEQPRVHVWNWWWVYVLSLVPLGGIAHRAWQSSSVGIVD